MELKIHVYNSVP